MWFFFHYVYNKNTKRENQESEKWVCECAMGWVREWGAVGVLFLLFPFNYNYNSRVKILFVAKNNFIAAAMCATIAAVCVCFFVLFT